MYLINAEYIDIEDKDLEDALFYILFRRNSDVRIGYKHTTNQLILRGIGINAVINIKTKEFTLYDTLPQEYSPFISPGIKVLKNSYIYDYILYDINTREQIVDLRTVFSLGGHTIITVYAVSYTHLTLPTIYSV